MSRPNLVIAILLFSALQASCSGTKCGGVDEGRLLQVYTTPKEVVRTFIVDHGAFGNTVTLTICDKAKNQLLEEIGLRGEDYLPTIDSLIGRDIYIHYSFPRAGNVLHFEDVVLGDALLNKKDLKCHYLFSNKQK